MKHMDENKENAYVDVTVTPCSLDEKPWAEYEYDDGSTYVDPTAPVKAIKRRARRALLSSAMFAVIAILSVVLCVPALASQQGESSKEAEVVAVQSEAASANTDEDVDQPTASDEDAQLPQMESGDETVVSGNLDIQDVLDSRIQVKDNMLAQLSVAIESLPHRHELGESVDAWHSQAAIDAGGIVEYETNYYCAHDYAAGGQFFDFEIGDSVVIDGKEVIIEGTFYGNYYSTTIEEARYACGWDTVMFQTCMPEGGGNVCVWYGHQIS